MKALKILGSIAWALTLVVFHFAVYLLVDLALLLAVFRLLLTNPTTSWWPTACMVLLTFAVWTQDSTSRRKAAFGLAESGIIGGLLARLPAVISVFTLFFASAVFYWHPGREPVLLDAIYHAWFVVLVAVRIICAGREAEAAYTGTSKRRMDALMKKAAQAPDPGRIEA